MKDFFYRYTAGGFWIIIIIVVAYYLLREKEGKPKKVLSEKMYQDSARIESEYILMGEEEKIILISNKVSLPYYTGYCILNDYYSKRIYYLIQDSLPSESNISQTIENISNKHHVSKNQVASIIYDFKFVPTSD